MPTHTIVSLIHICSIVLLFGCTPSTPTIPITDAGMFRSIDAGMFISIDADNTVDARVDSSVPLAEVDRLYSRTIGTCVHASPLLTKAGGLRSAILIDRTGRVVALDPMTGAE